MSVRLNPAQVVSQEFKALQATIGTFTAGTPATEVAQAKEQLEAMKQKIKDIVGVNPQALMGLALVEKGIPTLIKRCEALNPALVQPSTDQADKPKDVAGFRRPVRNTGSVNLTPGHLPPPPATVRAVAPVETPTVVTTPVQTAEKAHKTGVHGLTYLTSDRPATKKRPPTLRGNAARALLETTPAAPVVATSTAPVFTTITVKCKVPFGHTLTIRGQGGDLDWSKGKTLEKIDDETYVYRMEGLSGKVEYKLLLDDVQWEAINGNRSVESEKSQEVAPTLTIPKVPVVVTLDAGSSKVFIRGTGPGMSWEKGVELKPVNGKFVLETDKDLGSFEFKVLLNDKQWSQGENFKVIAGQTLEIAPKF